MALWLEVWLEPDEAGVADHVEPVDVESEVETVAVLPADVELVESEADELVRTAVAAAARNAMVPPSPRKAAALRTAAATRDRAAA